jgi:hypothetical protein
VRFTGLLTDQPDVSPGNRRTSGLFFPVEIRANIRSAPATGLADFDLSKRGRCLHRHWVSERNYRPGNHDTEAIEAQGRDPRPSCPLTSEPAVVTERASAPHRAPATISGSPSALWWPPNRTAPAAFLGSKGARLCGLGLSEAHARSAIIFPNELDAGCLQDALNRLEIVRYRNCSPRLEISNGTFADLGFGG